MWSAHHPWRALLAVLIVTMLAGLSASKLEVQSNFVDLLPQDQPSVRALRKLEKVVGGASYIVLTVEPSHAAEAPPFLEALATRLAQHPDVRFLDYRPPVEFFRKQGLMYLDVSQLDTLYTKIERRIAREKLGGMYMDLAEEHEELSWSDAAAQVPAAMDYPYYQSPDGSLFVMLIKPVGRSTNIGFTKQFVASLQQEIVNTRSALGAAWSEEHMPITLTGPYIKAIAQVESVSRDAQVVVSLAALLMIFVVTIYFRSKRSVMLLGLPLAVSVIWSLGITQLLYGALNFFTSICCAVILGLSADFGIHLFSHYLGLRRARVASLQALQRTIESLSRSMAVALVTTAAAFFSLMATNFAPLYEFGAIAGTGLLCAFLGFLLIFPALTVITEHHWPITPAEHAVAKIDAGWRRILAWCQRAYVLRVGVVAGISSVIALSLFFPQFDYNFGNVMGAQPTRALDDRVDKVFYYSVNPELAGAQSRADAAAFAKAVRSNQRGRETSTIQTALALDDFVAENQPARMAAIARIRQLLDSESELLEAVEGDDRKQIDRLLASVNPALFTAADLPESLVRKFRALDGSVGEFVYIFPSYNRQQGRELDQFVQEMRSVDCAECTAPVIVSGESVIFHEIMTRLLEESRIVIALSLCAVFCMLLFVFRSIQHALQCFAPLALALSLLLGIMGMFDIRFTLVNITAVPILLGTGVDYAIYYYQQWLRAGDDAYLVTAPAIFGSVLTTGLGFAAILFADNGGAASLGRLMTLGIVLCAGVTLIWFPAFLGWLSSRTPAKA